MKCCCRTALCDLATHMELLAEKDEHYGRNGAEPFTPDFWYQEAASLRALAADLRQLAEQAAGSNNPLHGAVAHSCLQERWTS